MSVKGERKNNMASQVYDRHQTDNYTLDMFLNWKKPFFFHSKNAFSNYQNASLSILSCPINQSLCRNMDLDESMFSEEGDEVTLQQVFEDLNTVNTLIFMLKNFNRFFMDDPN